jgi:HAD superfamily hydrolase (TIGR01509 family)
MAVDVYNNRCSMTEGLMDLLAELDRRGMRHGLVSSSPQRWIRLFLTRFGLSEEFDPIVSADDVGGRAKPEPEIYLFAARKAEVRPERCLAIEDSGHGVRAAKAAGMTCAGLRTPFNPEQDLSLADFVVTDLRELRY